MQQKKIEEKANIDTVRKLVFISKTETDWSIYPQHGTWMLPQILTLPKKLKIKQ